MELIHAANRWIDKHLKLLLRLWVIAFTLATLFLLFQQSQQAQNNRERIMDIQDSRVQSCLANYQAFIDVFRPFFPKTDDKTKWPKQQRKNWTRLQNVVQEKKAKCSIQVKNP